MVGLSLSTLSLSLLRRTGANYFCLSLPYRYRSTRKCIPRPLHQALVMADTLLARRPDNYHSVYRARRVHASIRAERCPRCTDLLVHFTLFKTIESATIPDGLACFFFECILGL